MALLAPAALLLALLSWRRAAGAEILCHSNPKMVNASTSGSFPEGLRAFVWSGEEKCLLSAGGGEPSVSCHWEANVTADVSWKVEETIQGHSDAVCAVAWSPDGGFVLTGSADGTARVWRAASDPNSSSSNSSTGHVRGQTRRTLTGVEPVATLRRHNGTVRAVTFSPDGQKALTGSTDGTVRVWQAPPAPAPASVKLSWNFSNENASNATDINILVIDQSLSMPAPAAVAAPRYQFGDVCVNQSCTSTSGSGSIGLHQGDSGGWTLASFFTNIDDVVWATAWPHHSRVLVGRPDRTACIQSPVTGSQRTDEIILVACTRNSVGPRWSARGDSSLRDNDDRTARIWSAHWRQGSRGTPQWKMEARIQDRHMHNHLVTVAALSFDGTRMLTGSRDGIVRMWHAGFSGDGIGKDPSQWTLMATLVGHTDTIWAVAWAPDSSYVLSGGRDNVTHIWKPSTHGTRKLQYQWEVAGTLQEIKCLFTIDHAVESVYYAGKNMTANVTGDLLEWEQDKGLTITAVPGAWLVIAGRNNQPRSCITGGFAITCTNGVTSADHRWEAFGSSTVIDDVHKAGGGGGWGSPCVSRSRFSLTADRFAKKLFASDDMYAVFRIRLATQEALGLDFFRRRVVNSGQDVGSQPIGVRADGTKDGLTGELQRQFVVWPTPVDKYSFRPEGERGHFPPVWVAAWSPDGQKVMTGSRDGSVRVWRLHTHSPMQWTLEAILRGHVGIVWSIAWSPDSKRALTAGHDGLVRVWRVQDLVNVATADETYVASDASDASMDNVSNITVSNGIFDPANTSGAVTTTTIANETNQSENALLVVLSGSFAPSPLSNVSNTSMNASHGSGDTTMASAASAPSRNVSNGSANTSQSSDDAVMASLVSTPSGNVSNASGSAKTADGIVGNTTSTTSSTTTTSTTIASNTTQTTNSTSTTRTTTTSTITSNTTLTSNTTVKSTTSTTTTSNSTQTTNTSSTVTSTTSNTTTTTKSTVTSTSTNFTTSTSNSTTTTTTSKTTTNTTTSTSTSTTNTTVAPGTTNTISIETTNTTAGPSTTNTTSIVTTNATLAFGTTNTTLTSTTNASISQGTTNRTSNTTIEISSATTNTTTLPATSNTTIEISSTTTNATNNDTLNASLS